jgi:hypothetical protein
MTLNSNSLGADCMYCWSVLHTIPFEISRAAVISCVSYTTEQVVCVMSISCASTFIESVPCASLPMLCLSIQLTLDHECKFTCHKELFAFLKHKAGVHGKHWRKAQSPTHPQNFWQSFTWVERAMLQLLSGSHHIIHGLSDFANVPLLWKNVFHDISGAASVSEGRGPKPLSLLLHLMHDPRLPVFPSHS